MYKVETAQRTGHSWIRLTEASKPSDPIEPRNQYTVTALQTAQAGVVTRQLTSDGGEKPFLIIAMRLIRVIGTRWQVF